LLACSLRAELTRGPGSGDSHGGGVEGRDAAVRGWGCDGRARARRGKTNFFEKRVGDYQKAGVMAGLGADARGHEISFDEDF